MVVAGDAVAGGVVATTGEVPTVGPTGGTTVGVTGTIVVVAEGGTGQGTTKKAVVPPTLTR